ncbi:MAG: D-alanine--D-alanine ligase [bacterium]|nr:D-alanine--D-alanine ligase [bacterium]
MKTVAIIAGGRSPEHEISVISARNIYNAIDTTLYKIEVIGISKSGEWFYLPEKSLFETTLEIGANTEHSPLVLMPFNKQPVRFAKDVNKSLNIDVFFPITHGVYGEDGILQGVLEYLNKPYTGPGVLGSAVGMDKDVTKQILQQNGIKVTPWVTYFKGDIIQYEELETMGYPLFVKPANMGSGVGVEKAENREELVNAIENAFKFDIKLLIEKGIKGREVETAVMGNLQPKVSGVGEIIVNSGFYTYENKYVNNETKVVIPAENLSASTIETITKTALKAHRCLQLEGLSRVDFFYVSDGEFYLNEVNTLPGFTNISMYPKLWEAAGVGYSDLITQLIIYAQQRYELRQALKSTRL